MNIAMRVVIPILVLSIAVAAQDKKPAKLPGASLNYTIKVMQSISIEHGQILGVKDCMFTNRLTKDAGECEVKIEVPHTESSNNSCKLDQKPTSGSIPLGKFDPKSVHEELDEENGSYIVAMDTTAGDCAEKGSSPPCSSREELYFDSEDSAVRFVRALVHAVALCGGTQSPF